jgi:hypothetical protein
MANGEIIRDHGFVRRDSLDNGLSERNLERCDPELDL